MAGIPNYVVAEKRQKLMDYIKQHTDESGYAIVTTHQVQLYCGLDSMTLIRYLDYFSNAGVVDYTREGYGKYLVHMESTDAEPSKETVKVQIAPVKKLRICPKCKTQAPDQTALFCFKCGTSLLSEKEQLRREFNNTLGYICRIVKNPTDVNKIMTVMTKVDKFAFAEEGEDDA